MFLKVINEIDEKCENLDDDIKFLCEKLSSGDDVSSLNFADDDQKTTEKTAYSSISDSANEEDGEKDDEDFYDFEEKTADNDADGKRAATYEVIFFSFPNIFWTILC